MEGHKVELLSKIVHEGMSSEAFEDQVFEIDQADQEVNVSNKLSKQLCCLVGRFSLDEWIVDQSCDTNGKKKLVTQHYKNIHKQYFS